MACRRIPDVLAPDNVCDALDEVVNADGELIGPEAVTVTDRKVAALLFRIFTKITEMFVVPVNYFVWNNNAEAVWLIVFKFTKAFPLINDFASFANGVFSKELLAAAGTGVDKSFFGKLVEDLLKKIKVIALNTLRVVFETEPFKVFVNAVDVFFAGAALIVVFDAQVYFQVPFFCGRPHVKGGKQMPFV